MIWVVVVGAGFVIAPLGVLLWFALWLVTEKNRDLRDMRGDLRDLADTCRWLRRENRDLRVRLETYRDDETYELLDRLGDHDTGELP